MRFSERLGFVSISDVLQTESVSQALRNSLWNVLSDHLWSDTGFMIIRYPQPPEMQAYGIALWRSHWKLPLDTKPRDNTIILTTIREYFFKCKWYEVYDFIEFTFMTVALRPSLKDDLNAVLARELAGYRLIGDKFVPITSSVEVDSISSAASAMPYEGVRAHIQAAVAHLSNKTNPDFRNSIKESISAVESLARELTDDPKATLGAALNTMEKKGAMHPALKNALSSLYGYTSDKGGIRHAMLEASDLDAADAKFMLVVCSAFTNYMKEKAA